MRAERRAATARRLPMGLATAFAALAITATLALASGSTGSPASRKLAAGNAIFAGRILALLGQAQSNVALSPFSISVDLGMVEAGARGKTAADIGAALHFGLSGGQLGAAFGALQRSIAAINRPGATLQVANALYGQRGAPFRRAFLGVLAHDYGAPLRTVDFAGDPAAALGEINGWVSQRTSGKIPNLLAPADVDTSPPPRLVLINAIYLNAMWLSPFDPARTDNASFDAPGGSTMVPTMHQDGTFAYGTRPGYRVLELPYVGGRLAFDILLPNPGELPALESALAHGGVSDAVGGLRSQSVGLALPRFQLDNHLELQGPLSTLGMPIAFTPAADFSGIAGRPGDLEISSVVHAAYIQVGEKGTEAAAATGTIIAPTAVAAPPPIQFDVDRPFVFVLRDRITGAVLFEGLVSTP